MLYELRNIILTAKSNQKKGIENVLATVVFLEGSSYRKPGVRMMISENGERTGAVSGGCIEKEISRSAISVFETREAKVIAYDGRHRLGCEGILYILIEPFYVSDELFFEFNKAYDNRQGVEVSSSFTKSIEICGNFGSQIIFENKEISKFKKSEEEFSGLQTFIQQLKPTLRLIIIGGEHDAVKLCSMASLLGWEVEVITGLTEEKQLSDFPGAAKISAQSPELFEIAVNEETVLVLMTHNYAQDLQYLLKLAARKIRYIGIIGSNKRREKLFDDLIDYAPNLEENFLENIYSPAGLNLGAITPEEIALSVLAQILALLRKGSTTEI